MFAANRNDRVKGRTMILVVSISTRNGLSQSGAPSGRKWAIDALRFFENLDRIIDNHKGRPSLKVKIRWLDKLNVYGIRPRRLIKIMIVNRGVTIELIPLRLYINVRDSWTKIKECIGDKSAVFRDDLIQNIDCIIKIIDMFKHRNSVVDGIIELKVKGSNEEKMSNIIQNMDNPLVALKATSLCNLMF